MKYYNSNKIFLHSTFRECDSLLYHLSQIKNFFIKNSYTIVEKMKDADIIFLSGCAVAHITERRFFTVYNAMKRKFPEKLIIPAGCIAKYKDELSGIGPKDLNLLDEQFEHQISINKEKTYILDSILSNKSKQFHSPKDYYIQISQGCINNCSYCSIKQIKGFVSSIPVSEILNKIIRLKKEQLATRFILLSDDCGSYGHDIKTDITHLLNKLVDFKKTYFSVNFFEPFKLNFYFDKIDKNFWKKVFFINIPIQTISQRLLKLMNRKYLISDVEKTIKKIRVLSPHITIATSIMYAVPTETKDEFEMLLNHNYLFDRIIFFPFSPRPNTPMGEMTQQSTTEIEEKTKKVRELWKNDSRIGISRDSVAIKFYKK